MNDNRVLIFIYCFVQYIHHVFGQNYVVSLTISQERLDFGDDNIDTWMIYFPDFHPPVLLVIPHPKYKISFSLY